MSEQNNFRIQCFSPVGIRDVVAHGIGNVKEVYTVKSESRFEKQVSLDGKVIFLCEDFDYFREFAVSDRRYNEVRADVYILCNSAWILKWKVFIDVRKGNFDLERKSFECTLSMESGNKQFDLRKGDEFNLFSIVGTRVSTTPQYIPGLVYTNGVTVLESIQSMLREILSVSSVKSDFFQWTPDDPLYSIGHSTSLKRNCFFHKSDIVKASSAGYAPATIMIMSLDDCIENLCRLYNLRYTIDVAGNFRIEHISWYSRGTGLDLTQSKYEKILRGTHKFSWEEAKIFRLEKFINPQSLNADFVGKPIRYDNDFIRDMRNSIESTSIKTDLNEDTDKGDDVLVREVKWITDIDSVYGNVNDSVSSASNQEQDLEGIVLLALDATGDIISVPSILDTVSRNNNINSWAVLHVDYWKYDRLFPEGYMNEVLTSFFSVQLLKKRATITIPFCCDESINVEDLVTTEYGPAVIQKVSFDPYRGIAQMELIYEDLEEIFLAAPVAVNDVYATNINTQINTLLGSLASVLANDTGAAGALPQSITTVLGGSASIDASGHFIYTPPSGVSGGDLFNYIALSATGRLDTGVVKIIIKVGTVFVHIVNEDAVIPGALGPVYGYRRSIRFYADPTLQIPLDLTGYGITISYTVVHAGVTTFTSSFLAVGYSQFIYGNGYSSPQSITTTINSSPAYTIV